MGESHDPHRNSDDAALLRRIANRDSSALGALYDRFSRPLFATAVRLLGDSREAEDLVHDVFLTLWEKAPDFAEDRGSAFAWAVTLTRNRAIDRLRQRKRRLELLAEATPGNIELTESHENIPSSPDDLQMKEQAAKVREAVSGLPRDQQDALELAFFKGLTQQEIATHLQQPLGTIKARIRRGLLKLRELLSSQPNL